jgi:catechol 2,3-dioxygenase-like lactoylglutathione lyase family enzyme
MVAPGAAAEKSVRHDAAVIGGAHTIIYAEDAEAARAFFRDVIGWPNVDAHGGWLIFELPPGELAFHPDDEARPNGRHELFLMCHDIEATVSELRRKGVEFTEAISEESFGRLTRFKIPGAGEIGLYEPRHPSPLRDFSS